MRELTKYLEEGIDFLLKRQFEDGHWEDYDLPVGRSDAWITAYVGLAVITVGKRASWAHAVHAGRRAANWLAAKRTFAAGWGFNDAAGPDADSTAYAQLLLTAAGKPLRVEDQDFLLSHLQPDGGFSTYTAPGAWGLSHPDVTPVAFWGLQSHTRRRIARLVGRYVVRSRLPDGSWPAYWWRTHHYSTYLNHRLAMCLGMELSPCVPVVALEERSTVHSAFDLSFVVATVFLPDQAGDPCCELLHELIRLRRPDGSWLGAPNLRVTREDAPDPWNQPIGVLYDDCDHIMTTASVIRVLADCIAQTRVAT